jgi:glycosyltransferase 2 family protein
MNESPAANQSPSPEHGSLIEAEQSAHPYRGFALRAGLGVAVVAILLWHYDARPILRIFSRERLAYFGAAIALYLAGQAMCAYRWQLLAAVLKVHGRYSEYLAYLFVGIFTNLFVPGLLGGDAARSVYLGRRHGRLGEAIASVVADRAVGLVSLFWVATFAAIFLNFAAIPRSVTAPTITVGVIGLAAYLASPLVARLIHLMPRPVRRAGGLVAPYMHHPATLLVPIAMSIVLHISLAICQYLLALGLGLSVPLTLFILCVPIANVIAGLPVTLNGLGLRESAYLVLFGMAGMRKEDAIALGLLWFAATALGGLTGAIAFATTPAPIPVVEATPMPAADS